MMKFTNSHSASCGFALRLSRIQRDRRPNLQFKINFFAEAHNFSLATLPTLILSDLVAATPCIMVATFSNCCLVQCLATLVAG